jgi:hypothetical protein
MRRSLILALVVGAVAASPSLAIMQCPYTGNYYEAVAVPGGITWQDAKTLAGQMQYLGVQGRLATITSWGENDFITIHVMRKVETAWVGGFQPSPSPEPSGNWQWITGEAWSYTNWGPGLPDNDLTFDGIDENALQVFSADYWDVNLRQKWNDLGGHRTLNAYIVEFPSPKKEISLRTLAPGALTPFSATLRGELIKDAGEACRTCFIWFQKGKFKDQKQTPWSAPVKEGQQFSYALSSLNPGKMYYCRAVANNSFDGKTTDLLSFITPLQVAPSGEFVVVHATPSADGVLTGTYTGTDMGNLLDIGEGLRVISTPKDFTGSNRVKAQLSWIGPDTGNLDLLPRMPEPKAMRSRGLETLSTGSLIIQGAEDAATVPLKVKVSCSTDIVGFAVANAGAAAVQLAPAMRVAADNPTDDEPAVLASVVDDIATNLTFAEVAMILQGFGTLTAPGSKFEVSGTAGVQLSQDGAAVGSPVSAVAEKTSIGGPIVETKSGVAEGKITVNPNKPIGFSLDLDTKAAADGSAWAYGLLTKYRIEFTVTDRPSVTMIVEQSGSGPDVAGPVYKQLLMATAQTAELTAGKVSLVASLGNTAGTLGHSLIVLANNPVSGLLMPVAISDSCQTVKATVAAVCSDRALIGEGIVALAFLNADGLIPVWSGTLADMFGFGPGSGVADMPNVSKMTTFELDARALPRGEGAFIVAFGSPEGSKLKAALLVDYFAPGGAPIPGE